MDLNHDDRMKEIQKRKEERERQNRKKQALVLKCAAAVFAAAIIFLLVFGIKSCVNAVSQRRAEKEAETGSALEQITPEPKRVISTEGNVDKEFYKNSVFVGNSFVDGMEIYELVGGADYFARIGLTVADAMSLPTSTGTVSVIDELNNGKAYNKIFLMFGENELGWESTDSFRTDYKEIIKKVREYQPDADIYLLSLTPVTKEVSDLGENGVTKENIDKFNKIVLEIAKETNVNFANICKAVVGEDGYLPTEAASDGVHFNEKYYKKCLVYIQNAFTE